MELGKRLLGEEHPDVATSLTSLALIEVHQGCYSKAEPLLVQALEIRQRRLGSDHPDTVNSRKGLARLRDLLNSTARNLLKSNQGAKKGGSKKKYKGFLAEYKRFSKEDNED